MGGLSVPARLCDVRSCGTQQQLRRKHRLHQVIETGDHASQRRRLGTSLVDTTCERGHQAGDSEAMDTLSGKTRAWRDAGLKLQALAGQAAN